MLEFNTVKKIETPFGDFIVKRNGEQVAFLVAECERMYRDKSYPTYTIRVNISDFDLGDEITCEILGCPLEYNDGDERVELYTQENDDLIIGVGGYYPQYHEVEAEHYRYELDEFHFEKFIYSLVRDIPAEKLTLVTDNNILLDLAWLKKADFDYDEYVYDTAIFMITI